MKFPLLPTAWLVFSVLVEVIPCNAQTISGASTDSNPLKVNVIPPLPEAASLGKHVDMPVNLYAGLPQIDIPIFQLKSFDLEIPISISYHASGIKAEEIPSWIGPGWSLNAGGVVSRTIRGFEDEQPYFGFLQTYQSGDLDNTKFFSLDGSINAGYLFGHANFGGGMGYCQPGCDPEYINIFYAARGGFDLEPDMFFYSLPNGESAKFVFDRNQQITQIPLKANVIQHEPNSTGKMLDEWTITGSNGTRYIFTEKDLSNTYNNCDPDGSIVVDGSNCSSPATPERQPANSSWKLTRIESATGSDFIDFEYEYDTYMYTSAYSTTQYDLMNGFDFRQYNAAEQAGCRNYITATEKRIKRITTKSGYEVVFNPKPGSRPDLAGARAIQDIIISFKGTEIKRVEFQHPNGVLLGEVRECYPGAACLPPTTFDYYESGAVLNRESKEIDHWGYYNGASNIVSVPALVFNNRLYHGADRQPNLTYTKTNVLTSITYPTKGKTEFDYELHDYSNLLGSGIDQYVVSVDLLASASFTVTGDINQIYSTNVPFTLTENTEVIFKYILPDFDGGISPDCAGTLTNPGYTKYIYDVSMVDPLLEEIPSGTYNLNAYFNPSSFPSYWTLENPLAGQPFIIEIYRINRLADLVENNRLQGGGLRIKEIRKLDINDQVLLVKKLTYTNENGISSGKLMSHPSYSKLVGMTDGQMSGASCVAEHTATFLVRTTNTTAPLALNQGVHVGYSRVKEENIAPGQPGVNNGYKIYSYKNIPEMSNGVNASSTTWGYKNGLLLKEQTYTSTDVLLEEILNTYDSSGYATVGRGVRLFEITNNGCISCGYRTFDMQPCNSPTEKIELRSSLKRSYSSPGNAIENLSIFYYTPYDQIESIEEFIKGTADPKITEFEYHTTDHTAITKKYSYFVRPGDQKLFVSGLQTNYNASIKPDQVHLLVESNVPAASPVFELRLQYTGFNPNGKPVEYRLSNNISNVIIWDDDSMYPIAEVKNAQLGHVAYTSFEGGTNGWTFSSTVSELGTGAQTGTKAFSGTASISLSSDTYKVTFWAKNNGSATVTFNSEVIPLSGSNWQLITREFTGSSVQIEAPGAYLDEVRVFPVRAELTSYTYKAGLGITSVTDVNNRTTYYRYDALNRLEFILDQDNNLVKNFKYHYSGE